MVKVWAPKIRLAFARGMATRAVLISTVLLAVRYAGEAGGGAIAQSFTEYDLTGQLSVEFDIDTPSGTERVGKAPPHPHQPIMQVELAPVTDDDSDLLDDTEMDVLDFQFLGEGTTLGPVSLNLLSPASHPNLPSNGTLEEADNNTPGVLDVPPFAPAGEAGSSLALYVQVEVPNVGLVTHNDAPLQLVGEFSQWPPAEGEGWTLTGGPVTLIDEDETPTGYRIASMSLIMGPPPIGGSVALLAEGRTGGGQGDIAALAAAAALGVLAAGLAGWWVKGREQAS